jgi:predicted Zn-dependent protease
VLDEARIDELRRRVEDDPASLAFAQLAEEFRRAGALQEAVRVCRDGLTHHPGYLSARVTLGRALFELGQDDEAQAELEAVLLTAPDNLIALRGIADIEQRRVDSGEPDPVLAELESWLSAILNERASRATS